MHANGFSLVRQVVADLGLDYDDDAPFETQLPLGQALLRPTRIYVRGCLAAIQDGEVKALSHITGGGFIENLPRVLPQGLGAVLRAGSWPVPPVFGWLAREGGIASEEMLRTFNCGIGMVLVIDPTQREALIDRLESAGE